jgi:catechol 2,3-dioxygenase-like lactoylglutathione lyase family enzyme
MIRHTAGIGEIVEDVDQAAEFYRSVGLEVKVENGYGVVELAGLAHFGLWSRADAAESTYGSRDAVDRVPLGFTVGFEVDSVDDAARAFESVELRGAVTEPWGQRTFRFRSPSGALCEITETPWARELATDVTTKKSETASP